jgi:hypothetical protein
MDVGFEGAYDTNGLNYPWVMKEGPLYKMWYSGYDGSNYRILYATSLDGLGWTSQGMVIDHGPVGSPDMNIIEITIDRDLQGTYHAWYTGTNTTDSSILNATSLDGAIWTKKGMSLGAMPGTLESLVSTGSVMISPTNAVSLWYIAHDGGGIFRIFLANYSRNGYVISESIGPFQNLDVGTFYSNKTDPSAYVFVLYTVLDGTDWSIIPGYVNMPATTFSLSSIDFGIYPTIRLKADLWDLVNSPGNTPLLHDWTVAWVDLSPPTFGGLDSAVDDQTGGNVTLNWMMATDPGIPITYNIYISVNSMGQDFGAANYSTASIGMQVTGLMNGVVYYFVVRAEDMGGYEDTNTVEKSAFPTTPVDSTPPDFAGIDSADDAGTGGTVDLGWTEAVDPDTIECNSDPSLPMTYNVYHSQTSGGQDFLTPDATTDSLSAEISGLTDGVTYHFVVRAMDSAGNEDNNLVELSAMPTTPIDTTPPQFSGLLSATDQGTSGNVLLTWSTATDPDTIECNSDPSTPIQYNIYYSTTSGVQDFSMPSQTVTGTQAIASGLQNGVPYYFVVRAEDAVGNEDDNIIEHIAIPTTPVDSTPPTFGGITNVLVDDDSGEVTLIWNVAIDPDEPECNSDPSNPIVYNIYMSEVPGIFNLNQPTATTNQQQHPILNLERSITYYFIVRAEDGAGNEETNNVVKSGELAVLGEGLDLLDYWWIFLVIIIILLLVVIAILSRKKKEEEPSTETKEEGVEEAQDAE